MLKQNRRLTRRFRNLVVLSTMTAIILSVSTYAWFIGMRTVNVSSFDVEIASTESLSLSLNGADWSNTVSISEDTLAAVSYAEHKNRWSELIPMSSIGSIDPTSSRMILYEKASLTPTAGGYRLLASRVDNTGANEVDGYVAFDLFIKNFSGTQYIKAYEPLDEEAIYLTTDSAVTVSSSGVADTGIENSVRVAFAQIGRVIGTEDVPATITGISCTDTADVTKICNNKPAQIWEPNDKAHQTNAISWYDTSCKLRKAGVDGANVANPTSYGAGDCGVVADGTAYPTYVVSTPITSGDNVDVYDGAEYNSYVSSNKLVALNSFTDTEKLEKGTSRSTFMTLAPNSITKVRIYIYIEGQDIDNYDFASIGKKISVMFGFTKERFTKDDIQYNGPDLNGVDDVPVITLQGHNPLHLAVGGSYVDPGFTATDDEDGDITEDVVVDSSAVNMAQAGTYTVTYNVTDSTAHNAVQKTRTVIVE